jgi:type VI secretion system protein ImpL
LEHSGAHLYRVPWCLMVGEEGSGRSALLASAMRERQYGRPDDKALTEDGWSFWFLDEGLVIDVRGALLVEGAARAEALELIRRARRRRPIDSVVLTISASDLDRPEAEVRARAEKLCHALRAIHDTLGVRCPIYVLITQADAIPGFSAFCRALPSPMREHMFGWSSPNPLTAPYATTWVDEAMDTLYGSLCRAQLALLSVGGEPLEDESVRDGAFTFAAALRARTEPLRLFLDSCFKASVYEEHLWLRGLYFCGDPSSAASRGSTPVRPLAFLGDLLRKKVFPERRLARPAIRSWSHNQRWVRALRWTLATTVLVTVLALAGAWWSLQRDVAPITSISEELANEVVLRRATSRPGGARGEADWKRQRDVALKVLGRMGELHSLECAHPWLPSSWVTDFDEDLREALSITFSQVVLPALHSGLVRKQAEVLAAGESGVAARPEGSLQAAPVPRAVEVLSPEQFAEYQALQALLVRLEEYRVLAQAYERLRRGGGSAGATSTPTPAPGDSPLRVNDLERLVPPLLGAPLPPAYLQRPGLYEPSLARATSEPLVEPADMLARLRGRTELLAKRLSERLFSRDNPLELHVRDIVEQLAALQTNTSPDEAFQHLADALRRVNHDLELKAAEWISRAELDPSLRHLAEPLRKSGFLAPERSSSGLGDLEDRWRVGLAQLQRRLREKYEVGGLGPVLVLSEGPTGRFELGPNYLQLKELIDSPFTQALMKQDAAQAPPASPAAGPIRVFWSEEGLDQALEQVEVYNLFIQEVDRRFPSEVGSVLRAKARVVLERRLMEQVERSRRIEAAPRALSAASAHLTLSEMSAELASLKRAAGRLRELLDTYEQLEFTQAKGVLSGQMGEQAEGLLRRVDAVLEHDALYTPDPRLTRWRGNEPPALEAFDVPDAGGLALYLKVQRERVGLLAREYASIPVSLLEAVSEDTEPPPLLVKWRGILTELGRREKMAPGNSVQVLEDFILKDMLETGRERCSARMLRAKDGGDWFLGRMDLLRATLRRRCESFQAEAVRESYAQLATRFNDTLAGHFPFAAETDVSPLGDASPEDVRAFYRAFDAFRAELDALLGLDGRRARRAGPLSQDMWDFVSRVEEARGFFTPLLASGDGEARYTVRMEPRINRRFELRANQIIEWQLEVDGRSVADRAATWEPGAPLRVAFRWAKDAPYAPAPDGQPGGALLGGNETLTFEYGGTWSLLRLLRAQQGPRGELERKERARPHVLRFMMQAREKARDKAAASATREQVRAFLRLEVSSLDGKAPLEAPLQWPVRAPLSVEDVREDFSSEFPLHPGDRRADR